MFDFQQFKQSKKTVKKIDISNLVIYKLIEDIKNKRKWFYLLDIKITSNYGHIFTYACSIHEIHKM